MLNEPTLEKLVAMRMRGMADTWLEQQQSSDVTTMDFDERFGLLIDAEFLYRQNRRRDRRLKAARSMSTSMRRSCSEFSERSRCRSAPRPAC